MANPIAPPIDQYRGTNIVEKDNDSVAWEVADFLFGAKSIKKIMDGEGTWGDALNVGITAATFLIPPAKIAQLGTKALRTVLAETIVVNAATDSLPVVAKAAGKTKLEIEAELARRGKPVEYNPAVTTAEDARTLEPNITLGPGATADDLAEYQASQGPAKFLERNPDLDPEEISILTNKNDIPSVDKSGKAVPNSERAADAKVKRDLNRGTPEEIKTAQQVDELNTKTPREPVKRSSVQAELDDITSDKNILEEMLTLSGEEVGRDQVGKVVGTLRRLAQKEKDPEIRREIYKDIEDLKKNGVSTNIVDRIKSEVAKLDRTSVRLQRYIDDPTDPKAVDYVERYIPFFKTDKKTGATTRDWASPRNYEAVRPAGKPGKAPDSPARSTLTELKSDEKSITRMIDNETDPSVLSGLRSDLKRTQEEIFNQETKQAREAIARSPIKPEQPKATPELAGAKKEIDKLQKEIDDLRVEYTGVKEPKIMPNGKELSVQQQRKLIVESARIKGEQIKKLEKRVPGAKPEKVSKSKEEQTSEYWKQDGELQASRKRDGFNSADQGNPTDVDYNSEMDALLPIKSFRGESAFLSNMSSSPIKLGGVEYPTVEHAFQAAKTTDPSERAKILAAKTAGEAKKIGRTVTLRKGWTQMREEVMEKALRAKFEQNPELKKKLLETEGVELIEGNTWGDTFWGQVNGKGSNKLGKLLMKIRDELMEGK
jgi:ribA/ribD-fused uncharacterized protein